MMILITLKQLTGYSKHRVLVYMLLTVIISFVSVLALITAALYAVYLLA